MVPPYIEGTIKEIKDYKQVNVDTVVAVIETKDGKHEQTLVQNWPVRTPRPYQRKLAPTEPMVTGQRVIDTLFPIASGELRQFLDHSVLVKQLFNINLLNGLKRILSFMLDAVNVEMR